jgi:hypothetical protein
LNESHSIASLGFTEGTTMSEPWQEDERTQVECVNDAPLTFDEMAFAMAVANVAAGGMPNVGSVHNRGPINLVAEDGTVRQLRLTNRPLNRAMMAVMDAFSHDQAKQESASYRVLFFPRVMEWPEAKPFVRRDGGSMDSLRQWDGANFPASTACRVGESSVPY